LQHALENSPAGTSSKVHLEVDSKSHYDAEYEELFVAHNPSIREQERRESYNSRKPWPFKLTPITASQVAPPPAGYYLRANPRLISYAIVWAHSILHEKPKTWKWVSNVRFTTLIESPSVLIILPISRCVRDLFFENTSTRERFCRNCVRSTDYPLANQRIRRHRVVLSTAAEVLTCVDCASLQTVIRLAVACPMCSEIAIDFLRTHPREEAVNIVENYSVSQYVIMISRVRTPFQNNL